MKWNEGSSSEVNRFTFLSTQLSVESPVIKSSLAVCFGRIEARFNLRKESVKRNKKKPLKQLHKVKSIENKAWEPQVLSCVVQSSIKAIRQANSAILMSTRFYDRNQIRSKVERKPKEMYVLCYFGQRARKKFLKWKKVLGSLRTQNETCLYCSRCAREEIVPGSTAAANN